MTPQYYLFAFFFIKNLYNMMDNYTHYNYNSSFLAIAFLKNFYFLVLGFKAHTFVTRGIFTNNAANVE